MNEAKTKTRIYTIHIGLLLQQHYTIYMCFEVQSLNVE